MAPTSAHLSSASPSPCLGIIIMHSGLWPAARAYWAPHLSGDHIPWQKTGTLSPSGSQEALQSTGFRWALGFHVLKRNTQAQHWVFC